MIITYHGLQCAKFQVGDFVLGYNPFGKESGESKPPRFGADVALSSMNHPDFNATTQMAHGDADPFLITGPGEYEVSGVMITGVGVETRYDNEKRHNTVYYLTLENMTVCLLGSIGSPEEVTEEVRSAVGEVDILFVPLGDGAEKGGVLSPREAHKVAVSFAPGVIIPMADSGSSAMKQFLEEAGASPEPMDKYTIKKKDLEGKEGEIVVLKRQ